MLVYLLFICYLKRFYLKHFGTTIMSATDSLSVIIRHVDADDI